MALTVTHIASAACADLPRGLSRLPLWKGNLLRERPPGPEVACWSGWDDSEPGAGDLDPGAGRFPLDLTLWGPRAWESLLDACRHAAAEGVELIVRPHSRHVLSDSQRCIRFLEEGVGGLALEPAAMLTESMLPDAEEHLERILRALAGEPGIWGLLLTGLEPVPGAAAPAGGLRACPLSRGVLAPELLLGAAERVWGLDRAARVGGGGERPVAILGEDVEAQLDVVRRGGGSATVGPGI